MVNEYGFAPDYVVAPGEILDEILRTKGMSKIDLADRCGLTPKTISLIIAGKAPVTPETAIQFERVLGMSASIWNNLESAYRLFRAKQGDREELAKYDQWLQEFPLLEMRRLGWLAFGPSVAEKVSGLLDFFGVGSVVAWEERYGQLPVRLRKAAKYTPSKAALAAWIRKCEIEARAVETEPFSKEKLNKALSEIRVLSCQDPQVFEPRMKGLMASAGVALVFVGELHGTHLSGAAQWLSSDKAMVSLSLRYKTDDQLWFTFFHEAAHLKLHSKKLIFIDGTENGNADNQEQEADRFASDYLISPGAYARFIQKGIFTADSIRRFAGELAIAPGIIVGRLQHDKYLDFATPLNHLKCRFQLVE